MDALTIDNFPPGASFEVDAGTLRPVLRVDRAEPLARAVREGGAFRIEFLGPPQPLLPQGTYTFRSEGEGMPVFIVPVGSEAEGVRYEAIFS